MTPYENGACDRTDHDLHANDVFLLQFQHVQLIRCAATRRDRDALSAGLLPRMSQHCFMAFSHL